MRIIPAIDLIGGKCVRLTRGDYSTKKVYNEDPLEVAKAFEAAGIRYLHLVDLDGARSSHIVNHSVLEKISSQTNLTIDFGGGLKSDEDLRIAFESGATQVTGGSVAVKDRHRFLTWLETHGPERIILGADARDEQVAVAGWEEASGEDLLSFVVGYLKEGVRYVVCTDISKDGMLQGPAVGLYHKMLSRTSRIETSIGMSGVEDKVIQPLKLIASGGITETGDLESLRDLGCDGAIIGKALYENRIHLKDLEPFL